MTQTSEQLQFEGQDDQSRGRDEVMISSPCVHPTGGTVLIMPDISNSSSSLPAEDSLQSPPQIRDHVIQSSPSLPVTLSTPSPGSDPSTMITLSPQPSPAIPRGDSSSPLQLSPDDTMNPRVASLRAMFPDFDDSLLLSVLQGVDGNQDQAIDILLGMSDPDYVSQLPPPQQRQEPTQTELDEQLARRLMLEEEQAAQHQRSPPQQDYGYQSYQSGRQAATRDGYEAGIYGNTAQRGHVQQRDTMAEFQDGFNKIAETGKKTFSSIVSKVKAKMQEFDQGSGPSRQDTQPTWGHSSDSSWSSVQPPANSSQRQYQPQYHEPDPPYRESYYDPNPSSESRTHESGYDVQLPVRPGGANSNTSPVSNTTYVAPNFATKPTPNSTSTTSRNNLTSAGSSTYILPSTGMGTTTPPESARQSGDAPRPPSTSTGMPSGIDPTKLGLLPKRPVSLLREPTPAQQSRRDDSDDELEYTENPFEERHR